MSKPDLRKGVDPPKNGVAMPEMAFTLREQLLILALVVIIFSVLILMIASREMNKSLKEYQRKIDKQPRGPTLFMGNPRPKSRISKRVWRRNYERTSPPDVGDVADEF